MMLVMAEGLRPITVKGYQFRWRSEPRIVTPRFVAAAIHFALAQGWQPEVNGPPRRLAFEDGCFLLLPAPD